MRAAPHLVGVLCTSDAAIRRAASVFENTRLAASLDQFDADEALEDLIDDSITDADIVAAVVALGLEHTVEAKARDIVAGRLRKGA